MKFRIELRQRPRMAQANTEAANAHEAARDVNKLHMVRYDVVSVAEVDDAGNAGEERVVTHWCEACALPIFDGEQAYFDEDGGPCVCGKCGKELEEEA